MQAEPHPAREPVCTSVFFINLWPQSGMKHYSESVVHALAPWGRIVYVRNYESCVPVEALRVQLDPVRLGGWSELWRIARAILRAPSRVIHLNSELPVLLPLFPLFVFCNSVITLHDAVPHEGESVAKRFFMQMHLLFVFLFIRKIIVHSAAIRSELPGFLRARTHVLPHVNYRLWAREKMPAPAAGPFVILFFGRLLPYKGLDYLLAAFRQLDPQKFTLLIAGDGELPPEVFTTPNIRVIHRFIDDAELPIVFNQAHAVALPYSSASQSGVAYMAFAFERPVVATRVGGLADVVADDRNGFLIEPRSAEALRAAIERLAEPATYARLVETVCSQNVSADEDIRARLLAVYRA